MQSKARCTSSGLLLLTMEQYAKVSDAGTVHSADGVPLFGLDVNIAACISGVF